MSDGPNKRIVFLYEDFETDEKIAVVIKDGFAESLPHVLKSFCAFLQAQSFVVDVVGAMGPNAVTHTSDDV